MSSFSHKYFNSQTRKIVVGDGIKPNVSGHDVSSEEMLYNAVSVWVSWENLEEEKCIHRENSVVRQHMMQV